jgi:uncharacterized membrane protein
MRFLVFAVMLATVVFISQPRAAFLRMFGDSVEKFVSRDGNIMIDVSSLAKVKSRHYRYEEGGRAIRFFIVRDEQGTVRAAIDACEVCWKAGKGYQLTDGAMLCVNCGMKFPLHRIGLVAGGCNPHPFRFRIENESVIIETQELMLGIGYFPENL